MNDHARNLAAAREHEPARQVILAAPESGEAATLDGAHGAVHPAVVAESATSIELLTVGEAVMRMDLLHAPVLMFRNSTSNALNVLYRRPDGHIGWVNPGTA